MSVASKVREIVAPIIESLNYKLWDVIYEKRGTDWYLEITIDTDRNGGINIDDCEKVHLAIEDILDEHDPIPGAYNLSVSSPGIERNLRYPEHFEAVLNSEIEIKLFAKKDYGSNVLRGILKEFTSDYLIIDDITVKNSDISKAKTIYDYKKLKR